MPLGYGAVFEPAKLSSGEVGVSQTEQDNSITTFLRILITIGEIGIAFTGIGAIAETGVGLLAGAANEVLDYEEGNISLAGTLLNFGTPFIGGAFTGTRNLYRAENFAEAASQLANPLGSALRQDANIAYRRGLRIATHINEGKSTLGMINKGIGSFGYNEFAIDSIRDFGSKGINAGILKPGANKIFSKGIDAALKGGDNAARDITEDKRFADFLEKSGVSITKQFELKSLLRGITTWEDQRSLIAGWVRDLPDMEALSLFRNVTGKIEQVALGEAWQLPYARQIMYEFDEFAAANLNEQFLKKEVPSLWKRIVRKVGSPWFNDKIVQNGQLIDPNDAGRAGVEHLYQLLKGMIRESFKGIKVVDEIEDAFVKSGGILVDSDWHLGYKVIKDLGLNKQLVQITYGKDTGRYRHILVFATDAELERYILSPGHTYLYTWAFSHGGKALGLEAMFSFAGIKSLGSQAASILGFIPIQALKNVLSLVSNYVENIHDIADGSYQNSYTKKFVKSLRNAAISRTFRLAGKEILGGFAGKYLGARIGDFIGREAQRVGTQLLATGVKNAIAGKDFGKGLGKKAIEGALVSVRSNSLRRLRRNRPQSVIVQTLSARRKLQQVKRIPNAVQVGRPFKGIKF